MPLHHTVGIDVSKARLDSCRLPDGEAARFASTEAGFRHLVAWSGESVECIAYEASGPCHRDLAQALLEQRPPAAHVNPWQARRFAEAAGRRVKIDSVDAAMLASMAAVMPLRPTTCCQRPAKYKRALLESNPPRNTRPGTHRKMTPPVPGSQLGTRFCLSIR